MDNRTISFSSKLRLAHQWLGDLISGEMIEASSYDKTYLGFDSISQRDLEFIASQLREVIMYLYIIDWTVIDSMGEIVVVKKGQLPRWPK